LTDEGGLAAALDGVIDVCLDRLDALKKLGAQVDAGKSTFTTGEFALLAGRQRATVQAWCRSGKVRATKGNSTRSKSEWEIPVEELARILAKKSVDG
jgi:hypothetical protein